MKTLHEIQSWVDAEKALVREAINEQYIKTAETLIMRALFKGETSVKFNVHTLPSYRHDENIQNPSITLADAQAAVENLRYVLLEAGYSVTEDGAPFLLTVYLGR
jgi:hypothetical protein